jgi:hypothetical protein
MKHNKPLPKFSPAPDPSQDLDRKALAWLLRSSRHDGGLVRIGKRRYFLPKFKIIVDSPKPPPAPEPFSISMRLTHGYVTGWNHLDRWHHLGEARVVDCGKSREDDESFRQTQIIEVNAPGYRPRNIMRAIDATMRFGCRCEHDCCGHYFGGATKIRKLPGNRYAVVVAGSRNI